MYGASYKIDVTQPNRYNTTGKVVNPDAHRIVDLRYNGRPIDDAAWFVVATNNYRAGSGGNFPGLDGSNIIYESTDTSQEILKDWLIGQKTVDVRVTPTWSFAPIAAPVQVILETSPQARRFLGENKKLHDQGDSPKGFARFSVDMK